MTNRTHKLLLHACPRCHGDLFPDEEDEGTLACLQCGRRIPEAQILTADERHRTVLATAA